MRTATKFRPRTKPPEERRDELLNSARRLFLKHGAGPTTIEQITSGAEVAKGTFYLYFSSKEDILAALGQRFAQELLASIKTAIAEKPNQDWKGKLATWARAGVAGYLDSIRVHDVVFSGSHRPPTRAGLVDNIIIDHLSGLLQAGADAGAWPIDDPRSTAVFLFSGLHGLVDDACSKKKRINGSRLARRLEKLSLQAVGLPSAGFFAGKGGT
jgi:AcrR family transcriptional regulator